MKRQKLIPLITIIFILILAAVLNPSPERHREKIRQVISERSELESFFGIGKLTAFVSQYKSLGIASYTTANGQVISIGVLGMIFVIA